MHHIIRRSQGGTDDPWNLITLCEAHHLNILHNLMTFAIKGKAPHDLIFIFGATSDSNPFLVYQKGFKATVMRGASLQPFPAGDEAVYARDAANKDSVAILGRTGKYLVAMHAYDPKNTMGKHFSALIAKLSGAPPPGKYKELITVLKTYKPLLFKNIPDDIMIKALDEKRVSLVGPGPTVDLEQYMMKDILAFTGMLDTPLTGGKKSLVYDKTKTDDFKDELWDFVTRLKDFLPEAASRLIGVVDFFKQAHKHMVTVRDAFVIPKAGENVYIVYKSHRGPGTDQTPESVYDTWVTKAPGINLVRSSAEYKGMSGAEIDKAFREHMEARYQLERYEEIRKEMLQNREKIIEKIVSKYDDRINSIHKACKELMK
ncbi:MAG: HNH endonuclease signature motif containing protein [Candidatus Eremiobacteraeota bacterium]|nr:HNH endonuclease signature motif containing protein [Candidatus Eremiobacteraeota bacterium]